MNKNDKENKACVILSGGMDSTTLLYDVIEHHGKEKVWAVCFDYGQRHKKEIECALESCVVLGVPLKVLDINVLNEVAPSALTRKDIEVPEGHYEDENMKQTVVPNRNMVLISLAASYAISVGAKNLYYGAHSGDHAIYPDCRKEFVVALGETIKLCDWSEVKLEAPYVDMDKGDIACRGKELGVDYKLTWTCYKGLDKACGKCSSCIERLEAFDSNDIQDPIEYERQI